MKSESSLQLKSDVAVDLKGIVMIYLPHFTLQNATPTKYKQTSSHPGGSFSRKLNHMRED